MIINANTKIAALLKQHPDALETIISISPKFEKLRNPILRKLMAGRASIYAASKMAGCDINTFFTKLEPLGFSSDKQVQAEETKKAELPDFIRAMKKEQITVMDVRPILSTGKDPLTLILDKIKSLQRGEILKIMNTFEPIPLIRLLEKQGFRSYTELISDNLVESYFFKETENASIKTSLIEQTSNDWEQVLERFKNNTQVIDVRLLEMPLPMLTILDAIDHLPDETAIYVYHKRIPVFLLPELAERKIEYRIKELSDTEVHLLLYKM